MAHLHHIVPRHMGGTDDPSNLIELSVEEHAEAHRILFEQYGKREDEIAWKALAKIIGHEDAIKMAHKNYFDSLTEEQRRLSFGWNRTDAARLRITNSNKRRVRSAESKAKTSESLRRYYAGRK